MTSTSHQRHPQAAATYVQFGSFQSPEMQMQIHKHSIQDPQSPDMIRKEVTSSFDVRPLYPRPCFPKQAQVLPFPTHADQANVNVNVKVMQEHDCNKGRALQDPRYQGGFFLHQQGTTVRGRAGSRIHPGSPDGFVYIHRQNSFIDVSQMTHHDHSSPAQQAERKRSRSNEEVDAAMTLANCLKSDN